MKLERVFQNADLKKHRVSNKHGNKKATFNMKHISIRIFYLGLMKKNLIV